MRWYPPFLILLWPTPSLADVPCTPPPGGKCITAQQLSEIKQALDELGNIHSAPAVVTTNDKIEIIQDWGGRVYVNGGSTATLKLQLSLGDTVKREMALELTPIISTREKPEDPPFRLRIRAQAGLLATQLVRTSEGHYQTFWDMGISLDFFHVSSFNVASYLGVNSLGAGVGYDLTRNFGPYIGYSLAYEGPSSSLLIGAYFSFD